MTTQFQPNYVHPKRRTVADLEADMLRIEATIRAHANEVKRSTELTDEGKASTFASRAKNENWAGQIADKSTAMLAALEATKRQAADMRASLVNIPTGPDSIAAEMRFGRRKERIKAAVNSGGSGEAQALLADAKPEDLGVLAEYIVDHYAGKGGHTAGVGEQLVEQELRRRSPEYAAAAQTATRAANAMTFANERARYLERLASDYNTPVPRDYELSTKSVTVAGAELGDLDADTAA